MQETLIDCDNLFIYPDVKSREGLFMLFHDALYKKGQVKKGFYVLLQRGKNLTLQVLILENIRSQYPIPILIW